MANIRLRVLPRLLPRDGREIELQTTATHIQWRYVTDFAGEYEWEDLIALTELIGPEGPAIEMRSDGTHIQYRVEGEGDEAWTDIIPLNDLIGPQGPEGVQGPSVSDGDKGDIVVSDAGSTWEFSPDMRETLGLPQLDGSRAGYDFVSDQAGLHTLILEPTFLNPTRRWPIDGSGDTDDYNAHLDAVGWAIANRRSLQYPEGEFYFPDQVAHVSSGNLVRNVNGVLTVSPGNGLRIFGKGEDDTIFRMSGTFPNTKGLFKLDGNMNAYTSTAANGGNPVGQGKNIIGGIGLWGRGQTTGTANRALEVRANWDLLLHDFKCVGFSGDMIYMYSAAGLGNDDVDSNARIVIERFSLLGGGGSGIYALDSRIGQLHVRDFEFRNFLNSGFYGSAIYSSIQDGMFAACGSSTSEGGIHIVDSGTQAFSRSIELTGVQFEANYGFEAHIEHARSAKLNNCHVAPYQPAGTGAITKSGILIGARAKNWEINHLTGANYANNEGYKIAYIRVADGAEAGIIDSPKLSNADTHMRIGNVNGLELRNIPELVDIDYAATHGSWPGVQAQNPIDITIGSSSTDVVYNGQVVKNGPRYPAARFHLAANASNVANVTGDGTIARSGAIVATRTEDYDYGSNLSAGVFTCPRDGWYNVRGFCKLAGFSAASHTFADLLLVINSGGTPVYYYLAQTEDLSQYTLAAGTIVTLQGQMTVYCAKNDTIEIGPRVEGGALAVDLIRSITLPDTFFMEVRKV